jgi:hypothetical protein
LEASFTCLAAHTAEALVLAFRDDDIVRVTFALAADGSAEANLEALWADEGGRTPRMLRQRVTLLLAFGTQGLADLLLLLLALTRCLGFLLGLHGCSSGSDGALALVKLALDNQRRTYTQTRQNSISKCE